MEESRYYIIRVSQSEVVDCSIKADWKHFWVNLWSTIAWVVASAITDSVVVIESLGFKLLARDFSLWLWAKQCDSMSLSCSGLQSQSYHAILHQTTRFTWLSWTGASGGRQRLGTSWYPDLSSSQGAAETLQDCPALQGCFSCFLRSVGSQLRYFDWPDTRDCFPQVRK